MAFLVDFQLTNLRLYRHRRQLRCHLRFLVANRHEYHHQCHPVPPVTNRLAHHLVYQAVTQQVLQLHQSLVRGLAHYPLLDPLMYQLLPVVCRHHYHQEHQHPVRRRYVQHALPESITSTVIMFVCRVILATIVMADAPHQRPVLWALMPLAMDQLVYQIVYHVLTVIPMRSQVAQTVRFVLLDTHALTTLAPLRYVTKAISVLGSLLHAFSVQVEVMLTREDLQNVPYVQLDTPV